MMSEVSPRHEVRTRFRVHCLFCSWVLDSKFPVSACYRALRHAKTTHPNVFGFVAFVERRN